MVFRSLHEAMVPSKEGKVWDAIQVADVCWKTHAPAKSAQEKWQHNQVLRKSLKSSFQISHAGYFPSVVVFTDKWSSQNSKSSGLYSKIRSMKKLNYQNLAKVTKLKDLSECYKLNSCFSVCPSTSSAETVDLGEETTPAADSEKGSDLKNGPENDSALV